MIFVLSDLLPEFKHEVFSISIHSDVYRHTLMENGTVFFFWFSLFCALFADDSLFFGHHLLSFACDVAVMHSAGSLSAQVSRPSAPARLSPVKGSAAASVTSLGPLRCLRGTSLEHAVLARTSAVPPLHTPSAPDVRFSFSLLSLYLKTYIQKNSFLVMKQNYLFWNSSFVSKKTG